MKKISDLLLARRRSFSEVKKALQYRLEFEKIIAEISTEFIHITVDKIHDTIHESFQRICEFSQIDRGYIFWYTDILGRHMEKIHEWCAPGIPTELQRIREINMGMFPYFDAKIKHLDSFITQRVEDLPPQAEAERKEFLAQKVKSFIFVPMIYEGSSIGFIGFETLKNHVLWSEDTVTLLKLASEIFVNALERIRADKTLRMSEERYSLIVNGVNDGLWDWDLKTNSIYYSPRWKLMLGYEETEISDRADEWYKRIHPEDRDFVFKKLDEHLKLVSGHFEIEHRISHKDGTYRWMLARGLAIQDKKGKAWRMAGSLTDITERIRFEEKLKYNVLHDSLTGLPNRVLFLEHLKAATEKSKTDPTYLFAVLFIDLDRFKTINDSFGHLFGDELLIAASKKIQASVESNQLVARLGGDEFTILLDIKKEEEAVQAAERIRQSFQLPFEIQHQVIQTSASIGIALSSAADIKSESDLLRNADTAMYRAKTICKGRHVIYNEAMHEQVVETLKLETDLRQGLKQKQFYIHYQPIISLQTGEIKGFEALLRWLHPERGLISPEIFIPLAEEAGIAIPIGFWVLREACHEAKKWKGLNGKNLSVSVNLSARQFTDPHFVQEVREILEESQLKPELLHVEITESVFIENSDHVTEILTQLKSLGVKLHLDDFGTGYSSLSYLHRFPLDVLKIDRSFIRRINDNGENSEIAKAIVSMAHNLNLEIVAEGIETPKQLEFLRAFGCEYGQGFFFAKPLTIEATREFALQKP